MKILHIHKFFYPKGGSETYYFSLMHELEKRGHEVIPFSMKDEKNLPSQYAEYFAPHISFEKGGAKKALNFIYSHAAAEALERLIQRVRPDVAHIHNFAHQLTPSILRVLRHHRIPIIYTAHDYQLICPSYNLYTQDSACERCHVFKYWNAVTHRCVRDSVAASTVAALEMTVNRQVFRLYDLIDCIIAPSQFMRDRLIDWKYDQKKVVYIPHGIHLEKDKTQHPRKHFLYVGRLLKEKGVDTLVHAMQEIDDELTIVGTGPEDERLRVLSRELKLQDRIHFVGAQPAEEVRKLMQRTQAVVVPSVWFENAPMVIYEALGLGTPVVGTRMGGIPELLIEGLTGEIAEAKNPHSLAQALMRVKRLSIDKMPQFQHTIELHMDRIEALYDSFSS